MKKTTGSKTPQSSAIDYADDSSDEEEMAERRSTYDIRQNIKKYTRKAGDNPHAEGSILAHTVGMELLYSERVDNKHYPQKRAVLGSNVLPPEEKMREWLVTTINKTIAEIVHIPSQKVATKALTKAFIEEHEDVIQATVQGLLAKQRTLFRQRHHQTLLASLDKILHPLQKSLQNFIEDIPEREGLVFATMETLSARKLAQDSKIRAALFKEDEAKAFLEENGLLNPDDESKTLTSSKSKKPNMPSKVAKIKRTNGQLSFGEVTLLDVVNDGLSGPVSSKLAFHEAKIVEAACVDIIQAEIKRKKQSILFETKAARTNDPVTKEYEFTTTPNFRNSPLKALHKASPEAFSKFLPFTADRLQEEIEMQMGEFSGVFVSQLNASRKKLGITLERAVLPEQHSFRNNNATDFLANIRLSNRSQTRQIRQAQEEEGNTIKGEIVSRGWQFAGISPMAIETQEITTNGARTDLMVNLGNYKAVSDEVTAVIEEINPTLEHEIGDRSIARWVRKIINGETASLFTYADGDAVPLEPAQKKQLQKLCVNLTSLILGTESARNPASLITQQMMLDLIISGDLSWETALADEEKKKAYGGGAMPMSMGTYEGAIKEGKDSPSKLKGEPVPCARSLQDKYAPYLIHPYRYPGESQSNSSKIEELQKRESDMVTSWTEKFAPKAKTLAEKIAAIRQTRESSWYK